MLGDGAVVFKYSKTTTGYHEEATTPHQATSVNVHTCTFCKCVQKNQLFPQADCIHFEL